MNDRNDLNDYKEALGAAYNHAGAYSNIIIGAGYAGFFAIWALTKDKINARLSSWSGILILISILFFTLFEVIKMVYTTIDLEKQARIFSQPDKYQELLAAHRNVQSRIALHLRIYWYAFFSIALISGLCAAGIILIAFIKQLINHP